MLALNSLFESLVNLEGCKTCPGLLKSRIQFESLVNLEGCKTVLSVPES